MFARCIHVCPRPRSSPLLLASALIRRGLKEHPFSCASCHLSSCPQINNAGILGPDKRQVTADGLELTMATNHFGHFLLTNLLLGKARRLAVVVPNPLLLIFLILLLISINLLLLLLILIILIT